MIESITFFLFFFSTSSSFSLKAKKMPLQISSLSADFKSRASSPYLVFECEGVRAQTRAQKVSDFVRFFSALLRAREVVVFFVCDDGDDERPRRPRARLLEERKNSRLSVDRAAPPRRSLCPPLAQRCFRAPRAYPCVVFRPVG